MAVSASVGRAVVPPGPPLKLARLFEALLFVTVVHHYRVHVRYACVVVVLLSSPISTVEAGAGIAESIVNASIKPNGRSPVAHIPDVEAVHERPISGRPKQARFRGEDPSPGNPVVARVVVIGPIAWHPD